MLKTFQPANSFYELPNPTAVNNMAYSNCKNSFKISIKT